MEETPQEKPLEFIGSAQKDLRELPELVRYTFGHALWLAQVGEKSPDAKPLKGFGGAGVLEVIEDQDGDTYRAVYTVRFRSRVYVLHVFKKKSKQGIATSQRDMELIRARLKEAERIEAERGG